MRGLLAFSLLVTLALTIALTFGTLWFDPGAVAGAKEIFTVAIASLTGLVGSAAGFYFGSNAGKR